MSLFTETDYELVTLYLNGELSPEQREAFEARVAGDHELAAELEEMRVVWLASKPSVNRWNNPAALVRAKARIAAENHSGSKVHVEKSKRPVWMVYVAAASIAAIVVVAGIQGTSKDKGIPSNVRTYTTNSGQRANITLADGSRITLGPATTLRVSTPDKNSTSVDIAGEAFFQIEHAAQHPFTVSAHGVTTRVLGTEFVVRAYDPSLVRVAVRDGRVSVQPVSMTAVNAAVIAAGEAASVTPNTLPSVEPIADLATEFSWANGELVLRSVPLGEAFVRLSRWYGVEFKAADAALLRARVHGVFPNSLNQADLDGLARIIGARVSRTATTITFHSTTTE